MLALEHAALLLCVWVHGCIGIHYWLRLAPWYAQARQILFALAVALPVTALAGFRWPAGKWRRKLPNLASWRGACRLPRARRMPPWVPDWSLCATGFSTPPSRGMAEIATYQTTGPRLTGHRGPPNSSLAAQPTGLGYVSSNSAVGRYSHEDNGNWYSCHLFVVGHCLGCRVGAGANLVATGGEGSLSFEMGSWRRARFRQPYQARVGDEGCAAMKTGEVIELAHILNDKMPLSGTRRFDVHVKRTFLNQPSNRRGWNEELVVSEIGQVGNSSTASRTKPRGQSL